MNTTSNHLKVTQNSMIMDYSGITEYFYLKLPLKPVGGHVWKIIEPFLHYFYFVLCLPKDIIQLNYLLCAPKLNEFCYFQKFNHRLKIHLLIQQKRC